jgi:hypothetical protein
VLFFAVLRYSRDRGPDKAFVETGNLASLPTVLAHHSIISIPSFPKESVGQSDEASYILIKLLIFLSC